MSICGKSELCIFDRDLPQAVIEDAIFNDIHPITAVTSGIGTNTVEFLINGSLNEYLDLNDSLLYVKVRVVGAKMGQLADDSPAYPCKYFFNSLFSDMTVTLNDTIVEGGSLVYPYKATLDTIFNYNRDTKDIQLLPTGYHENADVRKAWINKSREYEMCGSLRSDFFDQPKYLLPGIDIRVKLRMNKSEFSIIIPKGGSKPHLVLDKAVLYVRRVRVHPSVGIGHQLGLTRKNAHYPYQRTDLVTYTIAQGSHSYYKDNIFGSSRLPKFVVIGFVKEQAYSGGYGEEPFNFEHFNVSSVGLYRNGQSLPFRETYSPNFKDGLYTRDYVISMIQNTEHLDKNHNNGITLDMFAKGGYTLFTFNLTPDFTMSQCQLPRDGNLRLDVKFAAALPESINAIVYGIFDGEIQITKDHEIIVDK